MINRRCFITGIKSVTLSKKEKIFLRKYKPWGIILFSRNIKSIKQTKKLTIEIRKIFNDKLYPILLDQEGGRVNRLQKFFNADQFTGEFFGKLFLEDKKKFIHYYKLFISKTSYLLKCIGININTVPVLDIRVKGSSNIIGNRAFSNNPSVINKIGNFCIDGFHKNNIATVMKHIPGHGLAMVDSHKKTPVIFDKISKLNKKDFFTFKKKKSLFAMTGHVIYRNIDKIYTATHSQKVINFIRNTSKHFNAELVHVFILAPWIFVL